MSEKSQLPGRVPGNWLQDFTRKADLAPESLAPDAPSVPAPAKGGSKRTRKPEGTPTPAAAPARAADDELLRRLKQVQTDHQALSDRIAKLEKQPAPAPAPAARPSMVPMALAAAAALLSIVAVVIAVL
jgi:hypothetical protein